MEPISAFYPLALSFTLGAFFVFRFFYIYKNYMFLGRALGYFIVSFYYIWHLYNPGHPNQVFWARWSLTIMLSTEIFYFIEAQVIRIWSKR